MFRVLCTAALVAAATASAPAAASVVTDPCGDGDTRIVSANGSTLSVGVGGEGHDLARAEIRSIPDGVEVTITACGAIPTPTLYHSSYGFEADLPDGGRIGLSLGDFEAERILRVTRHLPNDQPPVFGRSSGMATEVDASGSTLRLRVRRAFHPDGIDAILAPGTVWRSPRLTSDDGRGLGVDRTELLLRAPGLRDTAAGSTPFTITAP